MSVILTMFIGLLEVAGYLVYIQKSLRNETEPNPTSWLMFAYGALVMTVLEWDRNASWFILLQPAACALFNIRIVAIVWNKGKLRLPESLLDRVALGADLLLTACYVGAKIAESLHLISEQDRESLVLIFLIISNLSLVICYTPLIRDVYAEPHHEHPLPWGIWLASYVLLMVVTIAKHGLWSEFSLYPAISIVIHITVLVLCLRGRTPPLGESTN